jgi:hypothetical protein
MRLLLQNAVVLVTPAVVKKSWWCVDKTLITDSSLLPRS